MTSQTQSPPPLRDAATVILVREKNKELEVYLLKRSTKSGFMGGLYVFPGGVVDDQDRGDWQPYVDLSFEQIKQQLCNETFAIESASAFSVAVIRETLEEAGILLASEKNKTNKDFDRMALRRLEKNLSQDWFKATIEKENWTLSFSQLRPWSHWITPEQMKKRFDTRFFIAFMPENQTCMPDNLETKHGVWLPPLMALEQNLITKTPLSPPAVVTLTHLLKFNTLKKLKQEIQSRAWGEPIAPIMIPSDKGPFIIEPWDPEFDSKKKIFLTDLADNVLDPGASFSRIWCDHGVWKPVRSS